MKARSNFDSANLVGLIRDLEMPLERGRTRIERGAALDRNHAAGLWRLRDADARAKFGARSERQGVLDADLRPIEPEVSGGRERRELHLRQRRRIADREDRLVLSHKDREPVPTPFDARRPQPRLNVRQLIAGLGEVSEERSAKLPAEHRLRRLELETDDAAPQRGPPRRLRRRIRASRHRIVDAGVHAVFRVAKEAEEQRAREANRHALRRLRFDLLLLADAAGLQRDLLAGGRLLPRQPLDLTAQGLQLRAQRGILSIHRLEPPGDRVERRRRLRPRGHARREHEP